MRLARSFINEHFAGSISLEELGRLTNLSPFHLHRAFRRQTGMPPHAYQIQVQVNGAKQLLLRGWPLAEVALATGFADQSHLTRHFRRLVGMTPGRYPCRAPERSRHGQPALEKLLGDVRRTEGTRLRGDVRNRSELEGGIVEITSGVYTAVGYGASNLTRRIRYDGQAPTLRRSSGPTPIWM